METTVRKGWKPRGLRKNLKEGSEEQQYKNRITDSESYLVVWTNTFRLPLFKSKQTKNPKTKYQFS